MGVIGPSWPVSPPLLSLEPSSSTGRGLRHGKLNCGGGVWGPNGGPGSAGGACEGFGTATATATATACGATGGALVAVPLPEGPEITASLEVIAAVAVVASAAPTAPVGDPE